MTIILVMCVNEAKNSHTILKFFLVLVILTINSLFSLYAAYLISIEFKMKLREKILKYFRNSRLTKRIMV